MFFFFNFLLQLMILAKAESLQEEAEDVLDALNSENAVNSSFL